MLYIRFSLIIFILSFSSFAKEKKHFTTKQCLESSFEFSIKHEGEFFGLLKHNLDIKKEKCIIEVRFKKILKKKWVIDICREPVHIKVYDKGSVDVVKRLNGCEDGNYNEDFCSEYDALTSVLQDDGLIFATGQRENLDDEHGKVHCTFELLKEYLSKKHIFSLYKDSPQLFTSSALKNAENCDLPAKNEGAKQSQTQKNKPIENKKMNEESSLKAKPQATTSEDSF